MSLSKNIDRFRQGVAALWQVRLFRYGVVGVASTGIHLAVAFSLLRFVGAGVLAANLAGFVCAYGFSYLVQARYVFVAQLSWLNSIRYFGVQLAALSLSMLLSGLLAESNPYARTVLVVLVIPLITFFIHKLWTFSTRAHSHGEP